MPFSFTISTKKHAYLPNAIEYTATLNHDALSYLHDNFKDTFYTLDVAFYTALRDIGYHHATVFHEDRELLTGVVVGTGQENMRDILKAAFEQMMSGNVTPDAKAYKQADTDMRAALEKAKPAELSERFKIFADFRPVMADGRVDTKADFHRFVLNATQANADRNLSYEESTILQIAGIRASSLRKQDLFVGQAEFAHPSAYEDLKKTFDKSDFNYLSIFEQDARYTRIPVTRVKFVTSREKLEKISTTCAAILGRTLPVPEQKAVKTLPPPRAKQGM